MINRDLIAKTKTYFDSKDQIKFVTQAPFPVKIIDDNALIVQHFKKILTKRQSNSKRERIMSMVSQIESHSKNMQDKNLIHFSGK